MLTLLCDPTLILHLLQHRPQKWISQLLKDAEMASSGAFGKKKNNKKNSTRMLEIKCLPFAQCVPPPPLPR